MNSDAWEGSDHGAAANVFVYWVASAAHPEVPKISCATSIRAVSATIMTIFTSPSTHIEVK